MMDIRKNKKLAQISQFIRKTNTKIYQRTRNVVRGIYYSRFLVFIRPLFERLRRLFRPIYQWFKPKIKRKKLHIYYILVLGLIFGALLVVFYIDLKKDYGYAPIAPADYSAVDWKGKADNNGFSQGRNFKWKVIITPPDKPFIFKPSKDIAEVKMIIKDLRGVIQVPAYTTIIDQEGNQTRTKRVSSIANQEELTLISQAHFTSLLGLSFISPLQGTTININGSGFNTATIQLPENTKVIKFGDQNSANSYKIDDRNIFFHSFSNAAVVYYHQNFHLLIQILILLLAIASLAAFVYFKKIKIPRVRFTHKDFLLSGLFVVILMVIFSLLIPNPDKLILNYDDGANNLGKLKDTRMYRPGHLPSYLRWVLFVNQSFDGFVIGKTNDCSLNEFRLSQLGLKKIIVIDTYQNNACAQKALQYFPEKTVVVPQNQVAEEIKSIDTRDYRYNNRLFPYNAKLIFLLSNALLAIACAYLIWMAFSIKKLKQALFFIATAFSSYFVLMAVYIFIGGLAHMTIGYHGATDTGLIMSNYFLPGVISGGNNIRMLFALLGLIFILIASAKIFKSIAYRAFFAVVFLFSLLMLIPATEYHAKRFILSGFSAEAYIWDYKMDVFNSLDLYKSIREVDFIDYYQKVTDPAVYGDREIDYAISLQGENRMLESQEKLESILIEYGNIEAVKARATFELANLYLSQAKNKNEMFGLKRSYLTSESYYKLALEQYINFINNYPTDSHIPKAINNVALIFEITENLQKAIKAYQAIIEIYPDAPYISKIKIKLAELYTRKKNYNQAINLYLDLLNVQNYPDTYTIKNTLANIYLKQKKASLAEEIYLELLDQNIEEIDKLTATLKKLSEFDKYDSKKINRLRKALELEKIGKNKEALRQYLNIEDSLSKGLIRSIAKYRANLLLETAISNISGNSAITQEKSERLKDIIEAIPNSYTSSLVQEMGVDLSDPDLEIEENYQILINGEYNLNSQDVQELSQIKNIIYYQEKTISDCGNNICEIGESSSICKKDCVPQDNKITISANAIDVKRGNWPSLKLIINGIEAANWEINSEINSSFSIPFEYLSQDELKIQLIPQESQAESKVYLQAIYLNQKELEINKILQNKSAIEYAAETDAGISLSEQYPLIKNIKQKTDAVLAKIIPYEFERYFEGTKISRGMALYFSGILCLLFISLYSNTVRTIVTPLFMLFIARGILRVAEQDPFRAWNSVYSGLITGIQLTVVVIALNSIIYIMALLIINIYQKIKSHIILSIK